METVVLLPPGETSLWRVAGLTVLERAALSALRAGFDRIQLWLPEGWESGERVARELAAVCPKASLTQRPFGDPGSYVLLPSDVVWHPEALAAVRGVPLDGGVQEIILDGNVVLWRASAEVFRALFDGKPATEVDLRLAGVPRARVNLAGRAVVRIDHPCSVVWAEQVLCEYVRRQTAASDGILARNFDRRISLWLSKLIVKHTRLRPNQITLLGTLTGLAGAAWLFRGEYAGNVLGTVLFWLATVIDGCDGEVARLKLCESRLGQVLDVATDNLVHAGVFLGLGVGYARSHPDGPYGWLTALLLAGFASAGAASYWALVRHPELFDGAQGRDPLPSRLRSKLLGALKALMTRDFSYLLLLLALVDRLHWFLWGAAFGSFGFCVLLFALYLWPPQRT